MDPATHLMRHMDKYHPNTAYEMRVTLHSGKQFEGTVFSPCADWSGLLRMNVPDMNSGGDRVPVFVRLDQIAAAEPMDIDYQGVWP